jgi:unspecific monooxygenase
VKNDWSGVTLPHPPGRRPVIGDLSRRYNPRTPLQNLMVRGQGLGPLFEMVVFGQKYVFASTAALAAELADDRRFVKALAPGVEQLRAFAGDGLFTAYNDEPSWRLAHDLLRPAFTKPAMVSYHDTMVEVARELVEVWDHATGPVEVSPSLTKLTLETIARTAFSHPLGSFTRPDVDPFVTAMVATLRHGQRRAAIASLPLGGVIARRFDRRVQVHRDLVAGIIDRIIGERVASGDTSERDLLGRMLHATHEETGARLDPLNIRYQVLTFLVAGHETTSGALSFALHLLSTHPQVLAAAQAETDQILGSDPDAVPEFAQVARFRYIRRVLDESLRLWPTAPGFARSPREETTLHGVRMRPQDWVLVVLPLVHRDPLAWGPDAEQFDPDRFLPEAIRARPAYSYLPFGVGERACIGRQFALHEAVLVLATLLHRYDLAGDPAYRLRVTERLTLMPEGFTLTVRRR